MTDFGIAVVMPMHGAAAMYSPSAVATAQLAAAEENARGGVGGRAVVLHHLDGSTPDGAYLDELESLIDAGTVHAVTGSHPSFIRHALVERIAARIPYVYPSVWEGGAPERGVFCIGETPEQQVLPALAWMAERLDVRRWCVVGDDYGWPRQTSQIVQDVLRQTKNWCGEFFCDYDRLEDPETRDAEVAALLDDITASGADGVIMLFAGSHAAFVNRAFVDRDLDTRMLRFSPLMDETMLLASGPEATRGMLSASSYANSLSSAAAMDFQRRYLAFHGEDAPTLSFMAASVYDAVRLTVQLANAPTGPTTAGFEAARAEGITYRGPRGSLSVRGSTVELEIRLFAAVACDLELVDSLPRP